MADRSESYLVPDVLYGIDPDSVSVLVRDASGIMPVELNLPRDDYLNHPFWASGIRRHDLALFAGVIDDDGASNEGFIVVDTNSDFGLLVRPDEHGSLADHHITPELAKKIATVEYEEVAQLGIERVIEAARQKYPGIRRFTR